MISINSKKIVFLTVLVILKLSHGVQSPSKLSSSSLPLKDDVIVYLRSIERIVEFCKTHTNDIDLNLGFGLFLLNVNLKHVILTKKLRVPTSLLVNLTRVDRASGALIEYFQNAVDADKNPADRPSVKISKLFKYGNFWVRNMEEFPILKNSGKYRSGRNKLLRKKFPPWDIYINRVYDVYGSRPTPEESDRCFESLEKSPSKLAGPPPKCSSILKECYELVYNGTDFGYGLAHRLLFLLSARYSRRCYVYSPQMDFHLMSRLCTDMYNEAQYIAANNFKNVDLLMEQVTICTLAGHVEFLQRSWVANVLTLQTSFGCFGTGGRARQGAPAGAPQPWRLTKIGTQDIMGGICNGHFTAVVAAALSAAVRYIFETFY